MLTVEEKIKRHLKNTPGKAETVLDNKIGMKHIGTIARHLGETG